MGDERKRSKLRSLITFPFPFPCSFRIHSVFVLLPGEVARGLDRNNSPRERTSPKEVNSTWVRFQHSGVFCITNEISFTIISLSSSDKFHLVLVQKGSPEVVYPRVNNFSILILFLSYLFVILSFGNPPLLQLRTSSAFFGAVFLLMFTIGGSTGVILGNAAVDLGLHS